MKTVSQQRAIIENAVRELAVEHGVIVEEVNVSWRFNYDAATEFSTPVGTDIGFVSNLVAVKPVERSEDETVS